MINKYFDGAIPTDIINKTEFDETYQKFAQNQIKKFEENMDIYHISNAIQELWQYVARSNKYIDETAPWVLAKNEDKDDLKSVMHNLAEALRKIAIMLKPIMPGTSEKILIQLGLNPNEQDWDSLYKVSNISDGVKVIEKGEPLFVRLEKDEEIEYIKSIMGGK